MSPFRVFSSAFLAVLLCEPLTITPVNAGERLWSRIQGTLVGQDGPRSTFQIDITTTSSWAVTPAQLVEPQSKDVPSLQEFDTFVASVVEKSDMYQYILTFINVSLVSDMKISCAGQEDIIVLSTETESISFLSGGPPSSSGNWECNFYASAANRGEWEFLYKEWVRSWLPPADQPKYTKPVGLG